MELPLTYEETMKQLLGEAGFQEYRNSFREPACRGFRLNPGKVRTDEERERVLSALPVLCSVSWSGGLGYEYEPSADLSHHPYYFSGLYYLQEPSAMAPGALLPVTPGDRVLDLCAAPGGKSTALGAALKGQGILVSNDVSASRAKALLKNLELFGIGNALVCSEEPERLAACFPGWFDKILIDAPCSGEGMFRREPSMIESWKERGPEYYVPIQRRLLSCAVSMLKPGGLLLYSTCTFSPREDEENIRFILSEASELEAVPIQTEHGFSRGTDETSVRLFPWKLRGEGHFAALMKKKVNVKCADTDIETFCVSQANGLGSESADRSAKDGREQILRKQAASNEKFLKKFSAFAEFRDQILLPLEERGWYWERDGNLYLLPLSPEKLPKIRFLRTGLFLGTMKKNRFEPSQALAMFLSKETFSNTADFSSEDIRTVKYLKGETIDTEGAVCEGADGWCLVCTDGWSLGFAKRNRGILKNKYYPGWRWQ